MEMQLASNPKGNNYYYHNYNRMNPITAYILLGQAHPQRETVCLGDVSYMWNVVEVVHTGQVSPQLSTLLKGLVPGQRLGQNFVRHVVVDLIIRRRLVVLLFGFWTGRNLFSGVEWDTSHASLAEATPTIVQFARNDGHLFEVWEWIFVWGENPLSIHSETSHKSLVHSWSPSQPVGILYIGAVVPLQMIVWSRKKPIFTLTDNIISLRWAR